METLNLSIVRIKKNHENSIYKQFFIIHFGMEMKFKYNANNALQSTIQQSNHQALDRQR